MPRVEPRRATSACRGHLEAVRVQALSILGPLSGAFAGRAAKEVVRRVLDGNGTDSELRKAEIDIAIIDAQAALGQRSARPFLQYLAGVVIGTYLVVTVIGVIYNSFVIGSPFEWLSMYKVAVY